MSRLRIGLSYDLRNPNPSLQPYETIYSELLEQMVWAETLGFDSIWFGENHFSEYGETPSVLLIAAALAARTTRIRVGTFCLVLPLHHPIRLAEDAACLAILSNGRFDLGVGAGSHEQDFAAFQRRLQERPSLMEEAIEIIRRSWSGSSFRFSGKRWVIPEITVAPLPKEQNIRLLIGGFSQPAIERAARLGDGFLCGAKATIPTYLDALESAGKTREKGQIAIMQWAVIDEDPERTWASIGRHALRQLNTYVREGLFGDVPPFADERDILRRGAYVLWDGPAAVVELKSLVTQFPQINDVILFAQIPGETAESGSKRMQYIASNVLPLLR